MIPFTRILTILTAMLFLVPASRADVVDRVVAIVNDEVITLSEVNEEGKIPLQRVAENAPPAQLADALREVRQQIIEKLIEKKILLQEAEKAKISVTDEEVDAAFQRILEGNKITREKFQNELASLGMDEAQYRENLKSQVLSSKLVNLEIRSKVIIPEDRIIDYYDTHYTQRVGEGGYYLLQIGVSWDSAPDGGSEAVARSKAAARKKAEEIRQLAVDGQDFRELARTRSDLPSAVDGGDIGILNENDMSTEMQNIVSRTKAGEISPIIETSSGYQFFKLLSSQEGQIITKVPYESVKDEIHEILYQQEMEGRFARWMAEKKSKAYIKIL